MGDDTECLYCHSPGAGVPDTGCGASVIGEETLQRHADQMGEELKWIPDAEPMIFRGFDNHSQTSIGVVELPWRIGKATVILRVHVVPGSSSLLISKPVLKWLGAQIDMAEDKMLLKRIDEVIELRETPGGQYEVDLLDRKTSPSPPGRGSGRRQTAVEARLLGEDFQ